jgi:hypothetical protein
MAVTNFVPDLWSAKLLVSLRKAHVAGNLVNREYEGEIKREGDTVKITSINDVTIGDYTAHSDITVEDIDDATRSLTIDQAKYFAVELDDIEAAQQKKGGGGALQQAVDNAAYQLADTSDAFILAAMTTAAQGTSNDLGTVAIHTTAQNLYDAFVDLNTTLSGDNVPKQGRFVVTSPAVIGRLVKLNLLIGSGDALGAETRTNGFVGRIAGLDVYESNNLPAVTDAAATGGFALAGYRGATTFAEQIVSVEAARMEKRFADMVKGLHVYGAKVVRPTGLAVVEFDATA